MATIPIDLNPSPNPDQPPAGRRAALAAMLAGLPPWVRLMVGLALGVAALIYARPHVAVTVPETPPPTVVVQQPPAVFGAAPPPAPEVAGKIRPGHRLLGAVARARVSAELQRTGFASVGGDPTPLSRARADELAGRLTDDTVSAAGAVFGAPDGGDGPVLAFVKGLLQWLKDNPEFLKFLLTLLMSLI